MLSYLANRLAPIHGRKQSSNRMRLNDISSVGRKLSHTERKDIRDPRELKLAPWVIPLGTSLSSGILLLTTNVSVTIGASKIVGGHGSSKRSIGGSQQSVSHHTTDRSSMYGASPMPATNFKDGELAE